LDQETNILRNVKYQAFLNDEKERQSKRHKKITLLQRLTGKGVLLKVFELYRRFRAPTLINFVSNKLNRYSYDQEFIRLIAVKKSLK